MNNSLLINPFSLLGVNLNDSLTKLKKNYYNMALICHPDKGGSSNDMHIINLAYNYIKLQIENQKKHNKTYIQLEQDFNNFCQNQETESPTFSQIYEETNDWIKEFNSEFDKRLNINDTKNNTKNNTNDNPFNNNPFDLNNGYGELMDDSLFKDSILNHNDNLNQINNYPDFNYEEKELVFNKTIFNKEIVEYEEPEPLPDTISYYPLDNKEINDYSNLNGNLKMNDYFKTFNEEEQSSKITNHKQFREYPKKQHI